MKKLSKIVLNQATVLERREMMQIFGENRSNGYHFFLRCDQNSTEGITVSDCSNETFIQYCGEDTSSAVCISWYY